MEIKKMLKENKSIIIHAALYFVFAILMGFLYLYILTNQGSFIALENNSKIKFYIIYLVIWAVISIAIGMLLLILSRKTELELHKKFFIVASILGLLYFLTAPVLSGSDETLHFYRIYEISQGNMLTPIDGTNQGSVMPTSLKELDELKYIKYTELKDAMSIALNKENTEHYINAYPSASVYSPAQYIPQVIGVFIGRVLNLNVYFIIMLGRLFSWIAWLLICTFAIKILPEKKMFAAILMLIPTSFAFVTTLSGDMMIYAMSMLFISYVYSMCYKNEKVKKKNIIILAICGIILSLCKIVYFPIILLVLLIPKKLFSSSKVHILSLIAVIVPALISGALWLQTANEYLASGVAASEMQQQWVMSNPITYILVMCSTFISQIDFFATQITAGNLMYHAQVNVYPVISWIFIVIVALSLFNEEAKIKITLVNKAILLFIISITTVLICTALYVQWTALNFGIGHPAVEGIQGRYLIPMLFVLLLLFPQKKVQFNNNNLLSACVIFHLPVLLNMVIKFIV